MARHANIKRNMKNHVYLKMLKTVCFVNYSSDDDDAEERCKTSIEKAIELDKENPDALQMMANFLLLKEKTQVKG